MAPGMRWCAYADGSCAGNRSLDGTGRKEPYNASARLPNSVQMGSWTVTRNTLHKRISILLSESNLDVPVWEGPLDLDLVDQCLDTGVNIPPPQKGLSVPHELRDGVPSISDTLLKYGSDESDCLRLVEGETPSKPFLGEGASLKHGRRSCEQRDEMENKPGGGRAYPALVGRSSWFGIKPTIRPLSLPLPRDPA